MWEHSPYCGMRMVQVTSGSIPQLDVFCFLFFCLPQFLSHILTHSHPLLHTLKHSYTLLHRLTNSQTLIHTEMHTHNYTCVLVFHYWHPFWPSFVLNNSLHMTLQLVNNKFSPREKSKLHFLYHSHLFANQQ